MIRSIIISGPPAVGKTTIAQWLAKEFNLQYLSGGDILKELASEQGFKTDGKDWWDTTQGMKFLNQRRQNFEFDKQIDHKLKKYFFKGNVIITSYTLPWLVNDGIKIWLLCSYEDSAKRMKMRDHMISMKKALQIVKKRYNENKLLYKQIYNIDFGDMKIFDKIIDTRNINAKQVFETAKLTISKLF